jgi:MFS family permease
MADPDRYELHTSSSVLSDVPLHGAHNRGLRERDIDALLERPPQYRLYKRRFIGLAQLILVNIIVSWNWLTFAATSNKSARFFQTTETEINWLGTAFLFAFPVVSLPTIWVLNRYGVKTSMVVSSVLVLVGNWTRYLGCVVHDEARYPLVMLGQIIIGTAQPFVLAAPTRYSNVWFSDTGRVSATAIASLANPFGAAIGQLIGPMWVDQPSDTPNMVLYTAIISTVATFPVIFVSNKPPTPPSALAESDTLVFRDAFKRLPKNGSFYLVLIPFAVYVACFNATSTLINQIFEPYGFTEDDAGIAGALLIFVGLAASAIISPIVDRTKRFLLAIKVIVPLLASCFTALIFMPGTRNLVGPYIVMAILGASAFSLLPTALELLAIITHPISPEFSSVVAWSLGQLLGAILVIVMDHLKGGWDGEPRNTLLSGLIFQAGIAWAAVPFALMLGIWRFRRIVIRT